MKILAKTKYGLRAMVDLAERYGCGPIKIEEIARRQKISGKYLEHIMLKLKKAGFVESVVGAKGGFILSKEPTRIRVIEIVEALEPNFSMVGCIENPQSCSLYEICASIEVWKGLKEKIVEYLSSITLSDLVKIQKEKKKKIYNYTI